MSKWAKATLQNGQSIYLDVEKITAVRRVRGQGKDFTAVFFGGNAQPFEIVESPEDFLGDAFNSDAQPS